MTGVLVNAAVAGVFNAPDSIKARTTGTNTEPTVIASHCPRPG